MTGDSPEPAFIAELRQQGGVSEAVLAAMAKVPRELFVPQAFQNESQSDLALPICCGQTISQPTVVAIMTDELECGPRHKVLEIGTGSGYQTAILSHLCRRVFTIERYRTLLTDAEARFRKLRLANIVTLQGDGFKGWPGQEPFDRIIVTAAPKQVPETLIDQLTMGGIMVIPVDAGHNRQELFKIKRTPEGYDSQSIMPVRFVPLVEGLPREAFQKD
jgi:protein-L-isoaspartate(D-aspartate) O-methyltransferase